MKRLFKGILFSILFLNIANAQEQKPAFWDDILSFKRQDSIHFPGKGKILFVGSSSFTKWTDVQNYFPSYPIINRGFGGSTLVDVIRYENEVIFKYIPKQIVIYCGENDIAAADSISCKIVFERFKKLYNDIRKKFPVVPVIYISMKPSPSRWQMKDRFIDGNERIQKFITQQKHAQYLSVWKSMLGTDGTPSKNIFIDDNLHMNANGYAIWKKIIEPYLLK
ncbi:MAG TPA: GDSL-type esterase/lipase family protein, partial [Chitinophagaceae bacterium]|nr:GDSL-type esterase/lipase family protein [Chitinophagaceae bacterium]